jgi:DoxX-like family
MMQQLTKIIYWVSTGLLSAGMLGSGLAQILHAKEMVALIAPLGYPLYFLNIIGTWKLLAVVAILLPGCRLLKEWAYAGLFFVMTGALISHLASGDQSIKGIIGPIMQTIFILLSRYCRPDTRRLVPLHG